MRLRVPVTWADPSTAAGTTESDASETGSRVRLVDFETPAANAERTTCMFEATGIVFTVNTPLLNPAGTTTEGGTVTADELLSKLTESPPGPAGPLSKTEPVIDLPPTTSEYPKFIESRLGGFTVNVTDFEMPDIKAVMTTFVWYVTPEVVIGTSTLKSPGYAVAVVGT